MVNDIKNLFPDANDLLLVGDFNFGNINWSNYTVEGTSSKSPAS